MSIKEALERIQTDRQRTMKSKFYELSSDYKNRVLEAGLAIHREAHVPELLSELAEIIKPNFPDVKINEGAVYEDGSVHLQIGWDYKPVERGPGKYQYKAVSVLAYPLTGDLSIWSKDEVDLLRKPEWTLDPKIVEDAIVRAFKNPVNMRGPAIRM